MHVAVRAEDANSIIVLDMHAWLMVVVVARLEDALRGSCST